MDYVVTAGSVTVETNIGPGRARVDLYRGQEVPADVPAEDIERLLALDHIAPAAEKAAPPAPPADPDAVPTGTIAEVLAWVGEDADRAGRAREAEAAKGDRSRSTLIADLDAIAGE